MSQPPAPPSPCTCFRIRKLARIINQRYDQALAPAGLGINQYSILRRADGEPRSIGALAHELGMERSTLSRDLKPLVAAGWVDVVPAADKRLRCIRLTASGRRKVARARDLWRQVQDDIEAELGGKATTALHAGVDRAIRRLQGEPA